MEALFLKILNMSIQASFVIMVVIILRFLLKKSLKWIQCFLWMLVALRLLCPFSVESTYSLAPDTEVVKMNDFVVSPIIQDGDKEVNYSMSDNLNTKDEGMMPKEESEEISILYVSSIIWLLGMSLITIYSLVSYLKIWKRVKLSINIGENIYICDQIHSPFILGIIRSHIYLPSILTEEQKESVIAHEKAHLKRLDYVWKPLGFCLLAVYWFNPLCWLAYILLSRDIELACDEKVIRTMNAKQIKAYSNALLSFSEPERVVLGCPLSFGEVGVKQRIKSILSYKKPAIGIIIVAIAAIAGTTIFFMTNPEKNLSVEGNKNAKKEKDIEKKIVEVSVPTIDVSANTGVDGSAIYYADDKRFIFGGYYGLFVYDVINDKIIRSIDLEPIGCNYTQGDNWCEIKVTEDGSLVFMKPASYKEMYVYSVDDNRMWMEPYNLDEYILYKNKYSDKSHGGGGTFEQDGSMRYYSLVNDTTIGELGYTIDGKPVNHYIFKPSIETMNIVDAVVSKIGLENAYEWNNTADLSENTDALIKMVTDETGEYEIYGIMSEEYGAYGFLLNDIIDGEGNWNPEYIPWYYSGAPEEQPTLERDDRGRYVFKYVYAYDGGPKWAECFVDCGYDTGHMDLYATKLK